MRVSTCLTLTLLANLATGSTAFAGAPGADGPRISVSWRLGFGADGAVRTGYGLALGYGSADAGLSAARLVELDVSDHGALARLAGQPLLARALRLDQTARQGAEPQARETPWYARQWVWWTAGGLAVTAALAGSGGGDGEGEALSFSGGPDICSGGGNVGPAEAPRPCVSGSNEVAGSGPGGMGCVNGDCAVECNPTNDPQGCAPFTAPAAGRRLASDAERLHRLDAGTGGMGDLVAR